jgi:hypothetical protein
LGNRCEVVFAGDAGTSYLQLALFAACSTVEVNALHLAVTKDVVNGYEEKYDATILIGESISETYAAWLENYKRFNNTQTILPFVADRVPVNGIPVEFKGKYVNNRCPDDDMFNEILWILENTHGKVQCTNTCWIFEDSNDAMMFSLSQK